MNKRIPDHENIIMFEIRDILDSAYVPLKREGLWEQVRTRIMVKIKDMFDGVNKTTLNSAITLTESDATMRRVCRDMKKKKYPLGADHRGYFKIRNQEDFTASQKEKLKKIYGLWGTIKAEKLAFEKYLGIQLELPKLGEGL